MRAVLPHSIRNGTQSIVAFDLRWREPPLQDVSCVGPPGHGCRLAGVVAQGPRCRHRAVDVSGTDGPGDDAGGGEPVDSEPPPAYRLWLIGVRADDLQISTGDQADEIRDAHPLMATATRELRPCDIGEPSDHLS